VRVVAWLCRQHIRSDKGGSRLQPDGVSALGIIQGFLQIITLAEVNCFAGLLRKAHVYSDTWQLRRPIEALPSRCGRQLRAAILLRSQGEVQPSAQREDNHQPWAQKSRFLSNLHSRNTVAFGCLKIKPG
jgi:hypothetical protein